MVIDRGLSTVSPTEIGAILRNLIDRQLPQAEALWLVSETSRYIWLINTANREICLQPALSFKFYFDNREICCFSKTKKFSQRNG